MPVCIFWFRRDLRLSDNAGLYHALQGKHPVLPLFIFDRDILDDLPERRDARVEFIHQEVTRLKAELEGMGSTLLVRAGKPLEVWAALMQEYNIAAVYTNRDYEPYAMARDASVADLLERRNIPLHTFKDHVIFERGEVLKGDGKPYTVFTPYSKQWRQRLYTRMAPAVGSLEPTLAASFYLASYPVERYVGNFHKSPPAPSVLPLADLGFAPAGLVFPIREVARDLIRHYDKTRDYPGIDGTSRLGIHFRFGTISIREKARRALTLNATYLNELIWRDFYSQILAHFPHVVGNSFRPEYDRVEWRYAPDDLERWRQGLTGYPLVDAGMRELHATGYMHNRVRMVTASFLSKHLLLDWRLGEAWFAQKLLDYDLASNSGGWQWAAGCGTDAAPYFRIFNPAEQARKFDPQQRYIRQWVPELGTQHYPEPMVDHAFARARCLSAYRAALQERGT